MRVSERAALLGLLILPSLTFAGAPEWVKQMSQSQNGSVFTSVCEGEGPTADIARRESIRHCKASAAEQLGTKVQMQGLVIRTDSQAAFHQEISETGAYEGLICAPKDMYSEREDGHVRFWMKCEFNLAGAKAIFDKKDDEIGAVRAHGSEDKLDALSQSSRDVRKLKSSAVSEKSENQRISVISVPACDDLLIRGPKARVATCHENPNDVEMGGDDTEIIVRKQGYMSKTIPLNDLRTSGRSSITVILDPM
jgi:hypothetical protein